jgi:hypothetical protein
MKTVRYHKPLYILSFDQRGSFQEKQRRKEVSANDLIVLCSIAMLLAVVVLLEIHIRTIH